MERPLFRPEAVHPSSRAHAGEIVLIRPLTLSFLTGVAAIIAVAFVSFFVLGSYTKRSTTSGQLVPDLGIIKVVAPQIGTVAEKNVVEGQTVTRGEVLYVITSEHRSSAFGETQALMSERTRARIRNLQQQIENTRSLSLSDIKMARDVLAGLQKERQSVAQAVADIRTRMELTEQKQQRYEQLRSKGYVSQDQYLDVKFEALDQKSRLDSLERDLISLDRQIREQDASVSMLPEKYSTQVAEYELAIDEAAEVLAESEGRRRWVVVAPESGTVTAVMGEPGQSVDASRPMLSIIPQGAQLRAHLYAPSNTVGFVQVGDAVHLRFRAYPYQKFGHYSGTVASVSRVSLSTTELTGDDTIKSLIASGEPVYRIIVELRSQEVLAYGKKLPLQAGMLVDADIMQETRRLYEWILEPLTTLTGKWN